MKVLETTRKWRQEHLWDQGHSSSMLEAMIRYALILTKLLNNHMINNVLTEYYSVILTKENDGRI